MSGLSISVQGLDQRFSAASVVFMRALLADGLTQVIQRETDYPVLARFNGVYITDSTRDEWLGAGVKVGVRFELQRGGVQACLTTLTCHDQAIPVAEAALPSGALHLADLGFFKLKRFKHWSERGVFWLTRYKIGTILTTPGGQAIDLKCLLKGTAPLCVPVRMGKGRMTVNAMLIAAPLPQAERPKRWARLREQARLAQRPLSLQQLDLAHWTLYLTNLTDLSFADAHILARTRWQIELLFKLWKSHAGLLRSRSTNPFRQQTQGYAKLLRLLIAHWSLLVADWDADVLSPLDALRILRSFLPLLQHALSYLFPFTAVFHFLPLSLATSKAP